MSIKCAKTRLHASVISKNFPGAIHHGTPLKGGTLRGEKEGKRSGKRRGKGKMGGEGKVG
jgi:hypothetical protein